MVGIGAAEQPVAVVGGVVGTVVGVVVDTVAGEGGLLEVAEVVVVVGVQQEDTASVVGVGVSRAGSLASCNARAHRYLHHTRCTYHPLKEVVGGSLVVVRGGMLGGRVSLHLAVFGFVGDRAGQDKSQGEVVVVAVAGTHTDLEKGSADEEVVPAVGQEEGAPVSSFAPCLGSTCLDLGWVVGGESHESVTAVWHAALVSCPAVSG